MEQRHQQIRERAGLEEARLNVEFIDALRKWGPWVLIILAVLAGAQFARTKLKSAQVDKVNRAFEDYNQSSMTANPSPSALKAVAEDFGDVRGIGILANLDAADAYLRAIRVGVKPGATVLADGAVENKDDVLTEQDRTTFLSEAETLYNKVVSSAKPDQTVLAVAGLYGLAAVAEGRQEFDKAKGYYEQIVAKAQNTPYELQAAVAKKRIDDLSKLSQLPKLYTQAELPKIKGVDPEPPPPAPVPDPNAPPSLLAPEQTVIPVVPAPVPADGGTQPTTPPGEQPQPAPAPSGPAKPEAPKSDAPKPAEPAPGTAPAPAPK